MHLYFPNAVKRGLAEFVHLLIRSRLVISMVPWVSMAVGGWPEDVGEALETEAPDDQGIQSRSTRCPKWKLDTMRALKITVP